MIRAEGSGRPQSAWGTEEAVACRPPDAGAPRELKTKPSPTRPQFAPLNKNSEDLGTSNFPVTSTSLLA